MIVIDNNEYEYLRPGDLIFVSSVDGWSAFLNKIRQGENPSPKKFTPTHVAIACGEGDVLFHATTSGTYYSTLASFVNNSKYFAKIEVFRSLHLDNLYYENEENPMFVSDVKNLLVNQWGYQYNSWGALVKRAVYEKRFCSELAVEFLQLAGMTEMLEKKAHKIYPAALYKICLNMDLWTRINPSYLVTTDNEGIKKMVEKIIAGAGSKEAQDIVRKKLQPEIDIILKISDDLKRSNKLTAKLDNMVAEMRTGRRQRREKFAQKFRQTILRLQNKIFGK